MVLNRILCDRKSAYVSDLSNAVAWMVSSYPLISKSSTIPLEIVLREPTTFGINAIFMIHRFLVI